MITVDGKDISTTWGLEPYRNNFYAAIMKDAGLKDRIIGDFPDTSGVIVPKCQSYTKSQEIVVSFLCDSYEHYRAFLTYCVAQKVVSMYVSETDETLRLEYKACSSFNRAGNNNIFAVKFQEANPMRRYGIFPFCAPAGFDVQRQVVDIVAKYHEYDNVNKRYAYSVYDGVTALRLEGGQSYLVGYEISDIKHTELVQHAETLRTTPFYGIGTEIDVDSTDGFTSSGIISYLDYNWGYLFFRYTSKTSTKFIGEPQQISIYSGLMRSWKVVQAFDFTGKTNGYVLVNNSGTGITANLTNNNEALWLYIGNNCSAFNAGYNTAIGGICRVKYIHYENMNIPFTSIGYSSFWNGALTGKLITPKQTKYIEYSPSDNYGNEIISPSITEITISENVERMASGALNLPNCHVFNFYPLVAPTVISNPLSTGNHGVLHINPLATGYDVAPWANTAIFSSIIRDL